MTILTIDFDKWGSGELLNPDYGKMCCLGFGCRKLGASDDLMRDKGYPGDIGLEDEFADMYGLTPDDQYDAANLNDSLHDSIRDQDWAYARLALAALRKRFRDASTTLRILNLPDELR